MAAIPMGAISREVVQVLNGFAAVAARLRIGIDSAGDPVHACVDERVIRSVLADDKIAIGVVGFIAIVMMDDGTGGQCMAESALCDCYVLLLCFGMKTPDYWCPVIRVHKRDVSGPQGVHFGQLNLFVAARLAANPVKSGLVTSWTLFQLSLPVPAQKENGGWQPGRRLSSHWKQVSQPRRLFSRVHGIVKNNFHG